MKITHFVPMFLTRKRVKLKLLCGQKYKHRGMREDGHLSLQTRKSWTYDD